MANRQTFPLNLINNVENYANHSSEWFFIGYKFMLNRIDEMHISKKISYNKYKKMYFIDFICSLIDVCANIV